MQGSRKWSGAAWLAGGRELTAPVKSCEETRGEEEERDRHVPGGFGTSAPYIPSAVRISIARPFRSSKWDEEARTSSREYKRETHGQRGTILL